jgi:hypothetical protein
MYPPAELLELYQLFKHAHQVALYAERAPLFTGPTSGPYLEDLLSKAAANLARLQKPKEAPCPEHATDTASQLALSPDAAPSSSGRRKTRATSK